MTKNPDGSVLFERDELFILEQALDMYIRLFLGQIEVVVEPLKNWLSVLKHRKNPPKKERPTFQLTAAQLDDLALLVHENLTGTRSGGPGIFNRDLPSSVLLAAAIQARLRGPFSGTDAAGRDNEQRYNMYMEEYNARRAGKTSLGDKLNQNLESEHTDE